MKFVSKNFAKIRESLKKGEVIVLASDTIYGFSADPGNRAAIKNLQKLKNRDDNKAFILLCSSFLEAEKIAIYSEKARQILNESSSPTTLVLPRKKNALPNFFPEKSTLAIRIVSDPNLQKFLNFFAHPLISTSVNIQGQLPLDDASSIKKFFPALTIFEQADKNEKQASRIIKVIDDEVEILR